MKNFTKYFNLKHSKELTLATSLISLYQLKKNVSIDTIIELKLIDKIIELKIY